LSTRRELAPQESGRKVVNTDDRFSTLMDRLRVGDNHAAAQVVERFTSRLVALARTRLDPLLCYKVDPEDLVQSVYKSFLKRLNAGDCNFENWEDLWSYLVLLTVRKCWDRRHYHRAAKRDVTREEPLALSDDESVTVLCLMARDPTPPQAAILVDLVEQLLNQQTPRDRDIVALHLQGFTIPEISQRLSHAQRTVRRTLARAKDRLREWHEQDNRIRDER
jgi:RNA polymerase sigma-70 factor, ECF subfamily